STFPSFRRRHPPTSTLLPYTTLFRSPTTNHPADLAESPAADHHTSEKMHASAKPLIPRCSATLFASYTRTVEHEMGQTIPRIGQDRKSTRLNSSHVKISYAVFCLKKT